MTMNLFEQLKDSLLDSINDHETNYFDRNFDIRYKFAQSSSLSASADTLTIVEVEPTAAETADEILDWFVQKSG